MHSMINMRTNYLDLSDNIIDDKLYYQHFALAMEANMESTNEMPNSYTASQNKEHYLIINKSPKRNTSQQEIYRMHRLTFPSFA